MLVARPVPLDLIVTDSALIPLDGLPSPGELLRAYALPAKKRFGQNFLTDPNLLDRICRVAAIQPGDHVIEIGPGPGGLTTRLLAAGARVTAIEADPDAVEHLARTLVPFAPLTLHLGDALGPLLSALVADGPVKVVANLPYHIATEVLFRLVDAPVPPVVMALMFQREVAVRIVQTGPDREFGMLGLRVGFRFEASLQMLLPPGAFRPPPKVHSAVVRLLPLPTPRCDDATERVAVRMGRAAFNQRRKTLRNGLSAAVAEPEAVCRTAGVDPQARPEAIDVNAFIRLAQAAIELDPSLASAPLPLVDDDAANRDER